MKSRKIKVESGTVTPSHNPSRQPLPPNWVKLDDTGKPIKPKPLKQSDKPPAQDKNVL